MADNSIALLCKIHPSSLEKQERILSLLQSSAKNYYRNPSSQCTTWSYMTPFPAPQTHPSANLILSGLEIYSTKSALQAQLHDQNFFQPYHSAVHTESLYRQPEELVAWYFTSGFVVREGQELATTPLGKGKGNLVSQTTFVCREEKRKKKNKEEVLEVLEGFVGFVREKEPGVLTYAAFTRPKAPKEILLVVRYVDRKAMMGHSQCQEHVDVVKKILPLIENDMGKSTTVWQEIDESFVSTQAGGPGLEAKL
ncbi:hypothetical protein CERZMDRAFT_97514 [Cercospora zeae-maydis SCOH1-5]|uniref:ABM domain-containing protein n=1 Tax=Cercospora zeae-maydis SCOH1-5 TaxID=717836 RepID=A0A6A6FFM1_9PEZI|nr:hypothetical protein CERZMDRAFT_97514 [Cercospora zeae-maydis SCOH1-5]